MNPSKVVSADAKIEGFVFEHVISPKLNPRRYAAPALVEAL